LTAECEDLYNYYLISYSLWAGNQTNNQTCETFSPKDEMVSLKTFESLGYCEDSLGIATFQAYISSIQQSADCLPELPKKLNSLDGQLKMTSKDCQTVYMNYKKLMYSYHHSGYFGGDVNRELEVVDSYEVFEAEGYCECFESYMRYLTPYLTYHYAASVSPAVSIVDWEGCNQSDWESNPCSRDSYREYEEIIQSFNEYCELYHIRDLQISRVSYEVFFSNELCDCLDDWAAYLQSLMDAQVREIPADELYKMNLDKFCENEAPCEPEVSLLEDFPEFPIADYIDPCLQGQTNMAYGNGVLAWQSYIALLTQEFVSSYNAHCLQPTESLNESYVDKEHHYTLYYYDQVGNLIKTIPPAGVQRLDIDSDQDELAQRIDLDRENHTHTIFTNHLMATKYEYNSLNQLVRQYLPDHDPMDISEVYQTNGLPVNLVVTEIQMVDAANGWLVGNIPFELFENFASDFGRVYKTTDGGSTWTRVNYILGANLKSIVMPTESIGFAVGEKGALVKTIDGGLSWFEIASEELIQTDLNQIIYLSESSIYAFGDKGKIYHSTNGGFSWSSIAVFLSETDNIISATVHGPYIYLAVSVLVNDFRKSKIFKFNPLQATIVEQKIKTNYLFGSNKGGNGIVSMHGADGQLFLLKNWIWNGTNAADLVCVDTYLKSNIYDSYFLDENKGVIISGDNPESAKLYATYNAGQTWEMVSPANHFYKELVPYYDETGGIKKLIGLRNNGELDRILFETSCGVVPMYLDGISNIKTLDTHFSNSLNAPFPAVAATTTEAKFTFEINNVMPTWLSLSTGNYADVTIKYEQPEEMSGLLVQTDGTLKAFYIDGTTISISSSSATGVVKCIANPSNDFGYTISTNGTIQSWNLNTLASLNGSTISSTASVPISYWSNQNSPADLSFRNGKLVVSNNKGEFMEIPLLANGNFGSPSQIKSIGFISELSQIETNSEIIAAAGANGDVFVKSDIDFIKANNN
jgi:hypothetical protein